MISNFHNCRVLRDIQCFFILSNENTDYRICYYPTELEVPPNESKVLTDRETNNRFSDLLEMSIAFSGTLKPDCSLAIIGNKYYLIFYARTIMSTKLVSDFEHPKFHQQHCRRNWRLIFDIQIFWKSYQNLSAKARLYLPKFQWYLQ